MPNLQTRPYSTTELNKLSTIKVDSNTPIRLYFRSADLLLKQARVYRNEGDFQEAYRLYMKYSNLGLTELPKHAKFQNPENKPMIKTIKQNCLEALDALEQLKPELDTRYNAYVQQRRKEQAEARKRQEDQARQVKLRKSAYVEDKTQVDEEERVPQPWSLQDELRGVVGVGSHAEAFQRQATSVAPNFQYPGVLQRNTSDNFTYQLNTSDVAVVSPPLPGKELLSPANRNAMVPPIPPKVQLENPPQLPPKVEIESMDSIPVDLQDYSGATTESGGPLRTVHTPLSILDRFLDIAASNTKKNLETCGILCGHLKANQLTVTTLLIPKQTSTSDTCTTENEEEVFDYQDRHDLLTLGWIHTHPTQSCFMSSVDLHTHCSYQLMLPEAIAIVCAPKHNPNYGIFRLTDPPGLDVITRCREPRAFHPHPDVPIYTDAMDLGHVRMSQLPFDVVDLR
ncbi:hypothetical protein VKS41_007186 [Umbelopsis sp. WA50703]